MTYKCDVFLEMLHMVKILHFEFLISYKALTAIFYKLLYLYFSLGYQHSKLWIIKMNKNTYKHNNLKTTFFFFIFFFISACATCSSFSQITSHFLQLLD